MIHELDQRVLHVWKNLSASLDTVHTLLDEIAQDHSIEIFEELDAYIHSEPTVIDEERFERAKSLFYGDATPKICPIGRFVRLTAENVWQHSDETGIRLRRSLQIEPPYARSLLVVKYFAQDSFEMYTLDNGKGFVHPTTRENILEQALRHQTGFGPHSEHGSGLTTALEAVDVARIISAGRMYGKNERTDPMTRMALADGFEHVKGSMTYGKVLFNSKRTYIEY